MKLFAQVPTCVVSFAGGSWEAGVRLNLLSVSACAWGAQTADNKSLRLQVTSGMGEVYRAFDSCQVWTSV